MIVSSQRTTEKVASSRRVKVLIEFKQSEKKKNIDFVENPEPRFVPQQVSNSLIFHNHSGAESK